MYEQTVLKTMKELFDKIWLRNLSIISKCKNRFFGKKSIEPGFA